MLTNLEAPGPFTIAVVPDTEEYEHGATAKISVAPSLPCYLTLLSLDANGTAIVLVPSAAYPNNFVTSSLSGNEFNVRDFSSGPHRVLAVCDLNQHNPLQVEVSKSAVVPVKLENFKAETMLKPRLSSVDAANVAIAETRFSVK